MVQKSINELTVLARKYHQAGDVEQAEFLYREILEIQPNNISVLNSLGNILQAKGNLSESADCYQKAIRLNPNYAGSYYNLGRILQDKGELDNAAECYYKTIESDPDFAGSYNDLGNILRKKEKLDEAVKCFRKAIERAPEFSGAYYNLAQVLSDLKQFDEAISCYQKTLQTDPTNAHAYYNLGNVFYHKGNLNDAIYYYQKALSLKTNFFEAYNALGNTFSEAGRLKEAVESYTCSLQINPDFIDALCNLGKTLTDQGKLDYAESCYKLALENKQDFAVCYSNLLLVMLYNLRYDPKSIFLEHLNFAKLFEYPLCFTILPHTNDRMLRRRLKIGYISPDFKKHSVARFIEPVLMAHNRKYFEIFCYSLVSAEDEVTERLQGYADHWRTVTEMSDENTAELIRNDSIDILVDLAGHTSGNRLLVFARKPAPVQITWIGYPATTGLSAMDYKIVDSYTDPSGITEEFYTEKLLRMPESFLCYLPDRESPEVGTLPALTSGHITFGSFNNFAKVSPEVIELWTQILKTVSDSRLILKAKGFSDNPTRNYVFDIFAQKGIPAWQISLLPLEPSTRGHLNTYKHIDIGLDTFPYNGTTTTCEALWMGVPVITLAGNTHASRVGMSLLSNVGLPELVAGRPDEYVKIAVDLARDLNRLQSLRERLRDMMAHSPLTDAPRFVSNLENCYCTIWEKWCQS
ncbi:MAG: tetratricopeptide repeat protein [Nitrospira sp.]|nr:tetratricopeptide repeat protein [Nitrospira sp.]